MKTLVWNTIALVAVLAAVAVAKPAMAEDKPAGDMEPIKVELPEAFFGGTPLDYWSPNLEAESYKPRAPFLAPKGTAIVSKGAAVTSSAPPTLGQLKQITDGDKDYGKKSVVELPAGTQWVQVDLGAEKAIYAIALWHWHEGKRVYYDIVVQASNDANFKDGVTTIYNNDADNSSGLGAGKDKEYIENNQGRLMDAKGVKARYVRLYSRGGTANENNNYIEAEVWGK